MTNIEALNNLIILNKDVPKTSTIQNHYNYPSGRVIGKLINRKQGMIPFVILNNDKNIIIVNNFYTNSKEEEYFTSLKEKGYQVCFMKLEAPSKYKTEYKEFKKKMAS